MLPCQPEVGYKWETMLSSHDGAQIKVESLEHAKRDGMYLACVR